MHGVLGYFRLGAASGDEENLREWHCSEEAQIAPVSLIG